MNKNRRAFRDTVAWISMLAVIVMEFSKWYFYFNEEYEKTVAIATSSIVYALFFFYYSYLNKTNVR